MVTFPAYWTTTAFTDSLGLIGWVEGPRARTWDPTSRWQQNRVFTGPTQYVTDFGNILVGDYQFKPFQLSIMPEGPNSTVRVTFYSDDFDGLYPRDPILTTWGLSTNRGNESVLWSKKTLFTFNVPPWTEIPRRIQVAQALYENMYGPMTASYWKTASLGTSLDLTQLMNSLFNDVVAAGLPNTTTDDKDKLWKAQQLFRLVLKGVTVAPRFEYVLRKTSIVFPRSKIGDTVIGSDIQTSYYRTGYMWSYKALVTMEPDMNSDTAVLLNANTMPRFWWFKQSPIVEQTSDSRWAVVQEYVGVEAFEPYIFPWVTAPGESFATGQFDPSVWVDAPSGTTEEMPPGKPVVLGVKDAANHQWTVAMQDAIFGNQAGTTDLG